MTFRREHPCARTMVSLAFLMLLCACTHGASRQVTYVRHGSGNSASVFQVNEDGAGARQLGEELGPMLSAPIWSPNGDQAVFFPREPDNAYLYDPNAHALGACITCGIEAPFGLRFSPDGREVAFGGAGVYLFAVDTLSLRLVGPALPYVEGVSWSPDGEHLAVTVDSGSHFDIYRLDLAEGRLVPLTEDWQGEFFAAEWSPVGDLIAYHAIVESDVRIEVMNPDGSGRRKVASWYLEAEIFYPGDQWPAQWSPDGERLLFTSDSPLGDADIFVVNADGSGLRDLTNSPGHDTFPVWSLDGRKIAFVSTRDGNYEIYVMDADGSHQVNVSNSPETTDVSPRWRPRPSVSPLAYAAGGLVAALLIGLIVAGALRRMRARRP
jgi:Tol biopolymer transport system component